MIDIEQLARDCGGEFDESGGIDFRRKEWGFFSAEVRDHIERREGPGSPSARLSYLLRELEVLLPGVVNPLSSEPPEPKLIGAVRALLVDKERLDSGCIMRTDWDDYGDTIKIESRGNDLRRMIDEAMEAAKK